MQPPGSAACQLIVLQCQCAAASGDAGAVSRIRKRAPRGGLSGRRCPPVPALAGLRLATPPLFGPRPWARPRAGTSNVDTRDGPLQQGSNGQGRSPSRRSLGHWHMRHFTAASQRAGAKLKNQLAFKGFARCCAFSSASRPCPSAERFCIF